ncbi:MAG: YraN family protein [Denitrovibrio sp.]|nr:MAG: YraN family protein [Denitrovibrio sp.]
MKIGFGRSGEQQAAKYLQKKGYKIITKNYRCKFGEIDIIARDKNTVVFVEVKARSGARYGMGYESVRPDKQAKLVKTAQHFLAENGESPARFDVVSIDDGDITHIENAFQ